MADRGVAAARARAAERMLRMDIRVSMCGESRSVARPDARVPERLLHDHGFRGAVFGAQAFHHDGEPAMPVPSLSRAGGEGYPVAAVWPVSGVNPPASAACALWRVARRATPRARAAAGRPVASRGTAGARGR